MKNLIKAADLPLCILAALMLSGAFLNKNLIGAEPWLVVGICAVFWVGRYLYLAHRDKKREKHA